MIYQNNEILFMKFLKKSYKKYVLYFFSNLFLRYITFLEDTNYY